MKRHLINASNLLLEMCGDFGYAFLILLAPCALIAAIVVVFGKVF